MSIQEVKEARFSDFAQLIGEVVGVERAPILFQVEKGKGTVKDRDDCSSHH